MEMACRLGFSIMLQELFSKVSLINEGNNMRDAYIYAAFCGFLWFLGQIGRHNAFYEVPILVGKIRS